MNHKIGFNGRRAPKAIAVTAAAAVIATVALSACGSSDSSGDPASGGATSAAQVDRAEAAIEKHLDVFASFKAPGESVKGLDKFSGGTITYVPITLQATYFQAQYEQISEAAKKVGLKVQICDAKAQPTVATQCLNQAIAGKSVGIITDSLPFAIANNAYAAAVKAGIPIVASDVTDPIPAGWEGKVMTTDNGQADGARLMADAIIADSNGKADVLFANDVVDSTAKSVSDAVEDQFKTNCPGCDVTLVQWEPTAPQKIPTAVSVALNNNPDIRYVYVQYDQPAGPPAIQGMKLSRQADELQLVGFGSDVSAMQRIKSGQQMADVASDPALIAWNNADRLFRLITDSSVPEASSYVEPRRVFNSTNIKSVDGSNVDDFKSGAWFSDGSFRDTYASLWGAN